MFKRNSLFVLVDVGEDVVNKVKRMGTFSQDGLRIFQDVVRKVLELSVFVLWPPDVDGRVHATRKFSVPLQLNQNGTESH
ncbi:hypothetical protein MAR_ORF115 [Marseillevirus marseillevirus]|uniref:Uncharacterized protein n=1 Tax=Marseillevirus marseillevirus TaxID=694581 RepID=D2XAC3_GBMV|nr:hypothetical protein MAR_ORF115 [Marseillevirus marseillevirus]ADB03900.1 hypothetical protein MAR_ORF115 [Marseillevirus marseillevirus]